jgi:hypothetical protein
VAVHLAAAAHHLSQLLDRLAVGSDHLKPTLSIMYKDISHSRPGTFPIQCYLPTSQSSTKWLYTLLLLPTISRSCFIASLPLRTVLRDGSSGAAAPPAAGGLSGPAAAAAAAAVVGYGSSVGAAIRQQ